MSTMETACTSLNSKLEQLSKEQSECTIYRVHRHLKNVNPSAYEPEVIAIGPYHRRNEHLKMMENHKLRNLHSLLERRGLKADTYAIAVSATKARKCYADLQDVSLTDSEFIEMLVLDGCFIIELVRKFADGSLGEKDDDPIFKMDWMITSLQRDLMLFENQVPYFVLRNLFYNITDCYSERTLLQLLTNFFSSLYPGKGHSGKLLQDGDHEIKHLLDLIHRNWVLPRPDQQSSPQKEDEKNKNPAPLMMPVQERKEKEVVMGSIPVQKKKETEVMVDMFFDETEVEVGSGMPLQETELKMNMFFDETEVEILGSAMSIEETEETEVDMVVGSRMPIEDRKDASREVATTDSVAGQEMKEKRPVIMRFINCATELTEANVEFKMEEKDTLFDIDFKDGVMVMPPLRIEDMTECFLRNLIVYEQYFQHQLPHTVVTDYMKLLDSLINIAKDVEILSREDIIMNWQGDDEVVANMVNRLGDLVACGGSKFSYATVFGEVNEHCKRPWNRWMAKLRRDYLNSPWAIISIIAAVVLLLLTVTQTLLSIFQVVQQN